MKKKKSDKNLGLAIAFLAFFILLVIASIGLKAFFLFNDARFDGKHRFNVLYLSENRRSILSFCPECGSITLLKINDKSQDQNIAKKMLIPLDGELSGASLDFNENVSSNLIKSLFSFGKIKSDLNSVDLIRLFIFAKTVPVSSVLEKNIFLTDNDFKKNSILVSVFNDPTIVSEKTRIEIINGTAVSGLGNRLAGLISNMGGVVVLVRNSENLEEKSKVSYFSQKNYTIKRLGKLLNFKIEKGKGSSIADVVILIGKDSLTKEKF